MENTYECETQDSEVHKSTFPLNDLILILSQAITADAPLSVKPNSNQSENGFHKFLIL